MLNCKQGACLVGGLHLLTIPQYSVTVHVLPLQDMSLQKFSLSFLVYSHLLRQPDL